MILFFTAISVKSSCVLGRFLGDSIAAEDQFTADFNSLKNRPNVFPSVVYPIFRDITLMTQF